MKLSRKIAQAIRSIKSPNVELAQAKREAAFWKARYLEIHRDMGGVIHNGNTEYEPDIKRHTPCI